MLSYIRQRISIKYFIMTTATIGVVFAILFVWMADRQKRLILEQINKQAVILHRQIVLTRQWVSDHGYVLVAGRQGTGSDYLFMDPALEDVEGKAYTRITPAALTRSLSSYAMKDRLYSFNLTNFNALNPTNIPDRFESDAIHRFCNSTETSISRVEMKNGAHVYRYAAPLRVQESCLACHKDKEIGAIGGCISVFIPFEETRRAIGRENMRLFLTMTGLTVSVIVVLFLATRKMLFTPLRKIRDYLVKMEEEAVGTKEFTDGDELKEFAGLCYRIDRRLQQQHRDLEEKIRESTRDLSETNRELERANRELAAVNKAKSEFFTDISHDLRTPLTAIKGAVDTLARRSASEHSVYLDIIRKNTEHLIRTAVDFIDFSRIESGRLELELESASMGDLIDDLVTAKTGLAEKKGVTIVRSGEEDVRLSMDVRRIHQVLSNLIDNALVFSPIGGTMEISLRTDGKVVEVSVSDQGPGVSKAYHEAIFDKFFQVPEKDRRQDRRKGSSGIGLAICKGIVQAHGGRISVDEHHTEGCRFVFALPVSHRSIPTTGKGECH